MLAVDTPGHAPSHIPLAVYGDCMNKDGSQTTTTTTTFLLTGDAVYGLDLLDVGQPDEINSDPQRALQSQRLIKEFARQTEVVVLPRHDVNTDRVVYKPG